MNIQQITALFQDYCHQGRSLDEVEILDIDGNVLCLIDKVQLSTDHEREVVQITVHHKTEIE